MVRIPDTMNGLTLTFADIIDRDVLPETLVALGDILRPYVCGRLLTTGESACVEDASLLEAAGRFTVASYHISGAGERTGHSQTSRHYRKMAIDISRINGLFIEEAFVRKPAVRAIVTAMQERFERYTPYRRENFGPFMLRKLGGELTPDNRSDYAALAEKHKSHMHFSINDPS